MQRVQLSLEHVQPRTLDLRAPPGVGLVGLGDRALPVRNALARRPRSRAPPRARRAPSPPPWSRSRAARRRRARADSAPGASRPRRRRGKALPQLVDHRPLEQPGVALVDRLDLELRLVTREVQVVLAVHRADELLRLLRVGVEVQGQGHARIRGMSSAPGGGTAPSTTAPRAARPRRGDLLELRIEGVAHGGAGVGAPGAVRRVRRRRVPRRAGASRDRCARSATTRTHAWSRCSSRAPTGCRSAATTRASRAPGRRGSRCATSASSSCKQELVDDALRRIGHLEGFELEPIVPTAEPWRYRNKMEYSFGTSEDGTLALGFHRRGRWDVVDDARDCMLASERSNAVRNLVRDWCTQRGPGRDGPPHPGGVPAQPRRARGPAHRRASGPARHGGGRVRARRALCGDPRRPSRTPTCCGPARTGSPR